MQDPKFMYGTHYSTPGYVIGYLVRNKPMYMLKLQSGKFDKPDRLFKSIKGDIRNILNSHSCLKELIPEFYQNNTDFLVTKMGLNLGVRQNQKVVNVLILLWECQAAEMDKLESGNLFAKTEGSTWEWLCQPKFALLDRLNIWVQAKRTRLSRVWQWYLITYKFFTPFHTREPSILMKSRIPSGN